MADPTGGRALQVGARPGAYPTIGHALADAPDGAVVTIAAGVYPETLEFTGGRVALAAAPGAHVVLDGTGAGRPVVSARGAVLDLRGLELRGDEGGVVVEDTALTLRGCALSGGRGPAVAVRGGERFEVVDCVITASEQGVAVDGASGRIAGTTVSDVTGDGVVVGLGGDPVIEDCAITGCGLRGIYAYQYARPTIEGCEVAQTGAEGIAVAHHAAPVIRRCSVHDTRGVGIGFAAGCAGEVTACRVDNTAPPGVAVAEGATPTVTADAEPAAARGLDPLLAELDAMVGLPGVKAEVRALVDELQVNDWRRKAGLPVGPAGHHLIFAGAPGTGKTTVARIYGRLLKELGVLPQGQFREVARRDLVGQYIGHTAEKTALVFEQARGGVLFIDEAYTLSRAAGSGDFGQEAIDTLVKLMEDHRDEVAVIVAGYTGEMVGFLAANPGLASRFGKTVEFEDYRPVELLGIIGRMAGAGDYVLDRAADPVLLAHFERIALDPNFGNARDARRLFEAVRTAQSQRLRGLGRVPTVDELRALHVADVRVATAH